MDPTGYFSAAQIDRAEDFRSTQRLLGLAGLGLSGVTLTLIALRAPVERLRARPPIRGAAAVGAAIALVLVAVNLPLDAVAHHRAVDVGLSTQDWGEWLGDVAKAAGISAVFSAGGASVGAGGSPRRSPS